MEFAGKWTASVMHALAVALRRRGHYTRAVRLHRAATASARRGVTAHQMVALLNEHGVACKHAGYFDEAEAAYQRALALAETAEQRAVLEHNLGGLAHARGDMAAAEPHARRALDLRRSALGPDHPDVAVELAALAPILHGLGRLDEAEAMLRRVLVILGHDHPESGFALGNLGALLQETGRLGEAATRYEEALAIKRRLLGARHPDVAITLNNLGLLRLRQGRAEEAEALLDCALEIMRRHLAPDHPARLACATTRAQVRR